MGRKIREITVIIIIMLAVSVTATVRESKSLAKDIADKAGGKLQTGGRISMENNTDAEGGDGPEEPEGPVEPEGPGEPEGPVEPEGPEEPEKPIEKYEFKCPAPDGKSGYYVTLPKIEIIHVSEYGVTKFSFVDGNGGTVKGELAKNGDRACIGPEQFKEGGNSISVWMEDEDGGKVEDSEYSKQLLVDTVSPDIQLWAPSGLDAWYQREAMLSVKCSDGEKGSQIEQISAYAGKQLIGTTPNAQAAFLISQKSIQGDGVPVTVHVVDKAGNKKEVSRRMYIDNAPPDIAIQGIDNYMITSRPAEVCYRAEDDNILGSVTVRNMRESPEGHVEELPENEWMSEGEASVMRQQLSEDGIYKMELTASDLAGFVRSRSAQVIVDKKNPVIRFVDELDGRFVREFQWNHTLEETIKDFTTYAYEIRLDGKMYPPGKNVKTEGVHTFLVKAVDAAGNKAEARARFMIDRTPPEIVFADIKEGGEYEETCTFKVLLDNKNDMIEEIWIDGEKQAVNARSKVYQYTVQEYGEHIVKVKARDKAGNQSEADLGFDIVKKETIFEKIIKPVRKRFAPEDKSIKEIEGKPDGGIFKSGYVLILTIAAAGTVAAGTVLYHKRKNKPVHKKEPL